MKMKQPIKRLFSAVLSLVMLCALRSASKDGGTTWAAMNGSRMRLPQGDALRRNSATPLWESYSSTDGSAAQPG